MKSRMADSPLFAFAPSWIAHTSCELGYQSTTIRLTSELILSNLDLEFYGNIKVKICQNFVLGQRTEGANPYPGNHHSCLRNHDRVDPVPHGFSSSCCFTTSHSLGSAENYEQKVFSFLMNLSSHLFDNGSAVVELVAMGSSEWWELRRQMRRLVIRQNGCVQCRCAKLNWKLHSSEWNTNATNTGDCHEH